MDEPGFRVRAAFLDHGIPCLGFALEEKVHVNVWKSRLAELGLVVGPWLKDLKEAALRGVPDETPIAAPLDGGSGERVFRLGALKAGVLFGFFQKQVDAAGGDVMVIGTGYNLDGTVAAQGNSPAFMAPVMAGGCVDASHQRLVDALSKWNASHLTIGYYDGEIQLLSMVVAAGNWWTTTEAATPSRQRNPR